VKKIGKVFFIKNAKNISYCKNLQIRWKADNVIHLLSKTRIYGYHAELYSYDLFTKEFESKTENYPPFGKLLAYHYSTATNDTPCIQFKECKEQSIELHLGYDYEKKGFYLNLKNHDENDLPTKISDELLANNNANGEIKKNIKREDILEELKIICEKLNNLNSESSELD
jgi:hypothetical protein